MTWTQPHGTRMSLPVRAEMTVIFPTLVNRLAVARGRDYTQYGSWGFACRAIRGTRVPSNHSWGLAVDLEAPWNPQVAYSYGSHPHNVGVIAANLGIRWGGPVGLGGGYTSSYDGMHFEYMGTVTQAAALTRLVRTAQPQEVDLPTPADVTKDLLEHRITVGSERLSVAQLLTRSYSNSLDVMTRLEQVEADVAALKAMVGAPPPLPPPPAIDPQHAAEQQQRADPHKQEPHAGQQQPAQDEEGTEPGQH